MCDYYEQGTNSFAINDFIEALFEASELIEKRVVKEEGEDYEQE